MPVNPSQTPLVALYARQSIDNDQGIKQQVAELTKALSGDKAGWAVVDEYTDNETSASRPRGPKSDWARLLRDIDDGRVNTVMAVEVPRLLRRLDDVLALTSRPVRVIVTRSGLDTKDPMGIITLQILGVMAEAEIRQKEARATPYRAKRRADGVPTAGRMPLGYRWLPKDKRKSDGERFRIVEKEAAVVRWIFSEALAALAATGKINIAQISRDAASKGYTGRDESPLGAMAVRRILLNPLYASLLPAPLVRDENGDFPQYDSAKVDIDGCTPGNWTPIIDKDHKTAETKLRAVRAALLDPARTTNGGNTKASSLLSSISRCAVCGGRVRSGKSKEGFPMYRCHEKGHFQRRADVIDRYVSEVVIDRLTAPDAVSLLKPPPPDVDLAALTAEDAELLANRANVLTLVAHGAYTVDQALKETDQIDARRAEIADIRITALTADPLSEIVTADDARTVWEALPVGRQRSIIELLMVPFIGQVGKGVRVLDNLGASKTVFLLWQKPGRKFSNIALPVYHNEAESYGLGEAEVSGLHPDLGTDDQAKIAAQIN